MTDFPDRLSEIIAEYKPFPMTTDLDSIYQKIALQDIEGVYDWVRCFPVYTEKLFTMRVYRGSMTKAEIASIFFHALHRLAERVVAGSTTPRNHGSALHYQFRSALREITRAEQRQGRIQGAMEEAVVQVAHTAGAACPTSSRLLSFIDKDFHKKCVQMHVLDGRSIRSTAEHLGVSKSSVHRGVESGLQSIREVIGVDGI